MHNSRKKWNGPTKTSAHFTKEFYSAKYRLINSVGVPVQRKWLEGDAVPSIQTKRPHGNETPVLGKRRAEDDISPLILTTQEAKESFSQEGISADFAGL